MQEIYLKERSLIPVSMCALHRLIQIGTFCININPFPSKPCFLCVCSTSLLKTLWEKEKLLVTSNFSFSHSIFCPFGELSAIFLSNLELLSANAFCLGESKNLLFGNGLSLLFTEYDPVVILQ